MNNHDSLICDTGILTHTSGPLLVAFDVTSVCNFHCIHCFNNSGKKLENELSNEEALTVAMQIADMSPMTVCLCGGEPLLRKNIIEIIETISKSAGTVHMVSNGFLVDEKNIHSLKNAGLTMLQISLDGYNAIQHDTIRGFAGAFEKAINAINCAKKANLNIATAFAPNKTNYRTIKRYLDLCQSLGVSTARFMPLIPMGRGNSMGSLLLSADEYVEIQLLLKEEMNVRRNSGFVIEWGDPLDHFFRVPNNAKIGFNTYSMEIKADGSLVISAYIPVVVGNVRKHSLKAYWDAGYDKIWENAKFLEFIKDIENIYDINQLTPKPYSGEYMYIDLIPD